MECLFPCSQLPPAALYTPPGWSAQSIAEEVKRWEVIVGDTPQAFAEWLVDTMGEHVTRRARGAEIWSPMPTKQRCLPPRGFLSVEVVLGGGKA